MDDSPKLYTDLTSWWPIFSAPEDYAEEAEFYYQTLLVACAEPPRSVLELGSGGGNNASHMKRHFSLTLADRSAEMLAISRELNPECEHVHGDMRSVRLGRLFEAVFIHDAVMYLTSLDDLRKAIETAFVHCKQGGAALFCPDCVRETFHSYTHTGGHDGTGKLSGRSLRYLEWTWDPDPSDNTYLCDFAILLRENGEVRCQSDRHTLGLFARRDWLRLLEEVGFTAKGLPFIHSEIELGTAEVFVGVKKGER